MKNVCEKIIPQTYLYKKKVDFYDKMVHDIYAKEIPMILPDFQNRRVEIGIVTSLVTSFIRWLMKEYLAIYITKTKSTSESIWIKCYIIFFWYRFK